MKNPRFRWFGYGAVMGLTSLSLSFALGSVPTRGRVTDDTAIYQNLSEIRVAKQGRLDFDSDINRLSALEGRYRENLPTLSSSPALNGPMKRVSQQKYRYNSGSKQAVGSAKRPVRQ